MQQIQNWVSATLDDWYFLNKKLLGTMYANTSRTDLRRHGLQLLNKLVFKKLNYINILITYICRNIYFIFLSKWIFFLNFLISKHLNIYFACLSVCLGVCLFVWLYPINIKMAELLGIKFFVGPRMTPREGLWMIEFSKICL